MKGLVYKILLLCTLIIVVNGCTSNGYTHNSTKKRFSKLNEIINESFELEDRLDANLNLDDFQDELYVIRYNASGRRSLILCFGTEGEEYELHLNSSVSILPNRIGTDNIDPFVEILTEDGKFTIVQDIPIDGSCTTAHEFSYNESQNQFFLSQIITQCIDEETGEVEKIIRTPSHFGTVKLFDFNIQMEY